MHAPALKNFRRRAERVGSGGHWIGVARLIAANASQQIGRLATQPLGARVVQINHPPLVVDNVQRLPQAFEQSQQFVKGASCRHTLNYSQKWRFDRGVEI